MSEFMVFIAVGIGAVFSMIAYFMYQVTRFYRNMANVDETYDDAERHSIKQIMAKKGVDINIENMKENVLLSSKNKFRDAIRKDLVKTYFKDYKEDK